MTTDNQDKQQQDNDTLWDIVSDIVDQLQFATETAKSSAELIQKLLTVDQFPGISKEELSIVYCEYGTQDYRLIVDAGNQVNSTSSSSGIFDVTNSAIRDVAIKFLKPEDYPWFKTKADCSNAGFDGFGTVMIVPMRLGRYRRLGVFIIHSKEEHAYSTRIQRIMDVLSDRLAALIRSLRRHLRDELTYKLRNELLGRLASRQRMFESEGEILKQVLEHLKIWYDYDRIYFLMKNPLDIETYYQAIDENGEVHPNFRATKVLEQAVLLQIMGGEDNLNRLKMLPSDIPNEGMDALHGIIIDDTAKLSGFLAECKSWLGVTMHHPDGYVFGHIILHDTEMPYAYDKDDLRFMDAIADFMGFLLAEYRSKQKKAVIQKISSLPLTKPKALYETVAAYLHRLYGVEHFQIRAIESSSMEWKIVWSINEDENTSRHSLENDTHNIIDKFANENRVRENYGNEPLKLSIGKKNYLVTPMRAGTLEENWRVIGAFVIPANNPGRIASNVIDEVSDALGNRLSSHHSQQRYEELTAFVNKVNSLSSANLTQEQVLKIAHEYIKKVMFSENVYIALYDEVEDNISFPLIYQNGKVWAEMHNQKRKIDPTKLGRTEVIIRDKKPLFIKTKADSLAWYAKPNHKEHAGKPLASWIGVPIFTAAKGKEQKVRGVIATYHDELDHVYSIRDVFFLQNMAGAVSGLFRLLELKEVNQHLEEEIANNTALNRQIANQQEIISSYLERNRLKDSTQKTITDINLIFRRLDFFAKDIERYQTPKSIEKLLSLVEQGKQSIQNYQQSIKINTTECEEVYLPELIHNIIYNEVIPENLRIKIDAGSLEYYQLKSKIDYKAITQSLYIIISYIISEAYNKKDGISLIISFSIEGKDIVIDIFSENIDLIDANGFHITRVRQLLAERLGSILIIDKEISTARIILKNQQPDKKALLIIDSELWRDTLNDLLTTNSLKCEVFNETNNYNDFSEFLLVMIDETSYKRLNQEMCKNDTPTIIAILIDDEKNYYPYPNCLKRLYKTDESIQERFTNLLTEWGVR
ncbi:GAF domain-containing protein [Thiothrix subterranea]|uniref:GAF domain-containing protein n=1 Tax=Thiothrix subterranea TaxID=2735563 RepID=UPI00192C7264|nr:GAF domain-containing protein [Thiothrix subterranea]QQZ30034.1 GAF domain-containing protein [Thiothrix subterranea]